MADRIDIALKEFEQLRQEILTRTTLAFTVIGLDLTILGSGVAVFQDHPDVAIALALASSVLWLIFIDHASQVHKIGAYISLRLSPALQVEFPGALGWERFRRELDSGASAAGAVLYPHGAPPDLRTFIVTGGVSPYLTVLFGASPLALGAAFLASTGRIDGLEDYLRLVVLVAVVALWGVAVKRYMAYLSTVREITKAIKHAG